MKRSAVKIMSRPHGFEIRSKRSLRKIKRMVNELETSKIAAHLSPWDNNDNVIWLASTLCLHRNVEKFKFPQKLELERKKHILSLVTKALTSAKELKNPFALKAEELSPLEKN